MRAFEIPDKGEPIYIFCLCSNKEKEKIYKIKIEEKIFAFEICKIVPDGYFIEDDKAIPFFFHNAGGIKSILDCNNFEKYPKCLKGYYLTYNQTKDIAIFLEKFYPMKNKENK